MVNVRKSKKRRSFFARLLRAVLVVLAILIAIPVILVPVYSVVDPVSMPMLARYLAGRPVIREWRGIDLVSDRLKASVVMSEDGGFCRHPGVDLGALREEFDAWRRGEEARGASTITMQVARNLFLWNDGAVLRKVIEIPLALYLDVVLSKRRIMEIYLNIAEWGPDGQFGVEAGAQAAFGVDADALSWERAALLTVALPNPMLRLPANPNGGLRRVAQIVEARTRQYGERANCLAGDSALDLD